jgi:hypothetical protein
MKSLSKDKVLRWVSGQQPQGGNGGGGGSVDVAGYATQIWTEQNYVNKEFFSSLFKAYDANGNEVLPNDTETVIDNIKAMFGFWTEQYISALGQGDGGGGGGGASALSDLLDVEINNPTNGQSLVYDSALSKWVNAAGSGVDMDTVWRYLSQSSTQQINYSHLSGAVSLSNGTITIGSSSITPITSHQSLAGYAKELWVGQNYLPLAGGTITGNLTVNNTLSTGGNTTVGGDLKVNGGDLTVNEPNSSGASAIWFQSGGTTYGNLRVKASNGEFYFYNGTTGDGQSSVCVNAGWFYAYGQVTALSDERKKNVVGDIALTIEQIANARAVEFYWKDKRDTDLHVGSIAQDWQKILPQAVFEKDGELSMDYSVIALMCGITIARKVEDHESRLRRLEKMFALNENDIED